MFGYTFQWKQVFARLPQMLDGALVTLQIAVLSMVIGILLAILLTTFRLSGSRALSAISTAWVEVARNTSSPQAFVLRRNLALQFHPEITAAVVEGWIGDAGGRRDLAQLGLDAATLVRQTRELAAENRRRAAVLVDGFLAHVAAGRAQPIGSPARPV